MTDPNPIHAARAEATVPTPSPGRAVPMLDFDEDVVDVICQVTIAGEVFDVPPMAATTVEYFFKIKDLPLDQVSEEYGSAFDVMRAFIVRCLLDVDAERGQAALLRSRMSLKQLMERAGFLVEVSSGFPMSPPSASAASSPNGGGTTTAATLPAPAGPSPAPLSGAP
jgi:hypothetical protein